MCAEGAALRCRVGTRGKECMNMGMWVVAKAGTTCTARIVQERSDDNAARARWGARGAWEVLPSANMNPVFLLSPVSVNRRTELRALERTRVDGGGQGITGLLHISTIFKDSYGKMRVSSAPGWAWAGRPPQWGSWGCPPPCCTASPSWCAPQTEAPSR